MSAALVPARFARPDGGTLACGVSGDSQPLLVVSGLGGAAVTWELVLPGLAEHFIAALHDHRGMATAALVGHATGNAVDRHMAIDALQRLSRLLETPA